MELTFDRILGFLGIISAIVLLVLDKAGKLKGPVLLVLLGVAAVMTLPLALANSWFKDTPWSMLKFSKGAFMVSLVAICYSAVAIWISPAGGKVESSESATGNQGTTDTKHNKFFIQINKPEILQQYSNIVPGKQWGGNVRSYNPGPERLFNVFGFSKAYVEASAESSDTKVTAKFRSAVEQAREQYLSGKIVGMPEVGVGDGPWGTVLTDPLTEEQVNGIFDGSVRIYIASWAIWRDGQNNVDTAFKCLWLQPLPKRAYSKSEIIWHFCESTLIQQ